MSALSDQLGRVKEFFNKQAEAIDGIVAGVTGVTADVALLLKKIQALQESTGAVTPSDQLLLDQLESQANATEAKLTQVRIQLQALDAQTPPEVEAPSQSKKG